MKSAYQFSSRPDCNNTADVPSFTLRTALSAIPFVSLSASYSAQELLQGLLRFLRSFCFARTWLDPLGGQVLHHDCISMIVSRFTSFTDNFVIGCNQITKIFCTRYDSANTSSARGPCDFGPFTDLAISVFREVSIDTVFTQIHTSHRF